MQFMIWPNLVKESFLYVLICSFILFVTTIVVDKVKISYKLSYVIKKFLSVFVICVASFYALIFLIASFFAPQQLSVYPLELSQASNIATSINGLMSPFIAIAAAILTFMAFWVQYNANQDIHKENKKQQIEHQFYEMLKIHREMVSDFDFSYSGPGDQIHNNYYAVSLGSYPFSRKTYKITGNNQNITHVHYKGQRAVYWYLQELMFAYECVKEKGKTKKENFDVAYKIFFEGLENCIFSKEKEMYLKNIQDAIHWNKFGKLDDCTKKIIAKYEYHRHQTIVFQGHRSYFNPYYRHLYLIVKKIVNESLFNKDEKMSYLGILRAQMTSEEQMLLFYNWYSSYGYQWEENKGNRFFSQYKMIHNIDYKYYKFLGLKFFGCYPWTTKRERIAMFEFFEQKKKSLKI